MCGIFGILQNLEFKNDSRTTIAEKVLQLVSSRGPNSQRIIELDDAVFGATVLHIQGSAMVQQPCVDKNGNILLWNGEVFGGIERSEGLSDTLDISSLLEKTLENLTNLSEMGSKLAETLSLVEGPYCFLYYHALTHSIHFARDPFGRRSLLFGTLQGQWVTLCSTYHTFLDHPNDESLRVIWDELPIKGVYSLCLSNHEMSSPSAPLLTVWPQSRTKLGRLNPNVELSPSIGLRESSRIFRQLLLEALSRRVGSMRRCSASFEAANIVIADAASLPSPSMDSQPEKRIGVLFSGGIDSVLLAACLHLSMDNPFESIELINVTFLPPVTESSSSSSSSTPSPDRLAAIAAIFELKELFPTRNWILVNVDVTAEERIECEPLIRSLIYPRDTHMDLNIGTAFWFAARGTGYVCEYNADDVLAAYAATEDGRPLLRVGGVGAARSKGVEQESFMSKKQNQTSAQQLQDSGEVSMIGKQQCANSLCNRVSKCGCPWNMCKRCCNNKSRELMEAKLATVKCRVHKNEKPSKRSNSCANSLGSLEKSSATLDDKDDRCENSENSIINLDLKDDSVNDLNLSKELNGVGEVGVVGVAEVVRSRVPYQAECKVLLVGIGADEQLAGYSRHRSVYLRDGLEALEKELAMDMERLWMRNLGRDDRCISYHGREAWFPYLDERVVAFIQRLPISDIADMTLPSGEGDKKILRDAAKLTGLGNCSEFVKRAIQFGTRIAKNTNQQYHGSNRKGKGTSKID